MKTLARGLFVAATLITLGACSRHDEPADPPIENVQNDAMAAPEPIDTPTPLPTETVAPVNTADALPPPPPPAPDQQMLDDAAAVGMTSRTDRGGQAANDQAPVDKDQQ